MKSIFEIIKISFADPKIRISAILTLLLVFGLAVSSFFSKSPTPKEAAWLDSAELIPPGSVLVPLDLQNRDSLRDLIGAFATVDLFSVSPDGLKKGRRVARRVKLIRSPQNPDQFSALIPEDQAALLFANAGPLFAVIQSRQVQAGSSVFGKNTVHSRIRSLTGGGF